MSDFDLNALIRDALRSWKEADPHVIARRLLTRIPQEHRDAALASCLHDRVRIEIGRERMQLPSTPESATVEAAASRVGKSRWAKYAPWLMERVSIAGDWKLLGDCTADDLDVLAGEYAKRAAQNAAREERFRQLAVRLREAGAGTVADLGDDQLGVAA